jgi:hypothetical protein
VIQASDSSSIDFVRGDDTGLLIPSRGEVLRAGGEALLTLAFRAFGALPADNGVRQITRWQHRPESHLHTDLFVKFSRDFGDPIRDNRGKYEMESEVRFAALSRLRSFPITVPTPYFADFHSESTTGLVITQRIPFGAEGIEPHRPKCLDHEMQDPLSHYETILKALARIAGAHRSGRLSPDIATRFPYDPAVAADTIAIGYNERKMHELVAQYADFAVRCPKLLPVHISTPSFIAKLDRDACRYLRHEDTIKRFLQSNPELIALCHWNAQIDNAWFWRDSADNLQCGLIDWGHVNQLNVVFSLWGCLAGAGLKIWDDHLEDLLVLFTDEYHRHGGPRIAVPELKLHLFLYIAVMGLSYFMESPSRILFRLPEAVHAAGPFDPMFRTNETARNNLHCLSVFLNAWQSHDFGGVLDQMLDRVRQRERGDE